MYAFCVGLPAAISFQVDAMVVVHPAMTATTRQMMPENDKRFAAAIPLRPFSVVC
jgi:hypothetical protein